MIFCTAMLWEASLQDLEPRWGDSWEGCQSPQVCGRGGCQWHCGLRCCLVFFQCKTELFRILFSWGWWITILQVMATTYWIWWCFQISKPAWKRAEPFIFQGSLSLLVSFWGYILLCMVWCAISAEIPPLGKRRSDCQVSKEQVAAALPEENKVYPFERVGCEEWCMDTYIIYPRWN